MSCICLIYTCRFIPPFICPGLARFKCSCLCASLLTVIHVVYVIVLLWKTVKNGLCLQNSLDKSVWYLVNITQEFQQSVHVTVTKN